MKHKNVVLILAALAVVAVGCERLAALQNFDMRISGQWRRIEMSFPGNDVYDFSERVITVNGIEQGTYRSEGNSQLEVTLDGRLSVYEVEFADDSTMIWYRKTSKGRDRVSEWRRTE